MAVRSVVQRAGWMKKRAGAPGASARLNGSTPGGAVASAVRVPEAEMLGVSERLGEIDMLLGLGETEGELEELRGEGEAEAEAAQSASA